MENLKPSMLLTHTTFQIRPHEARTPNYWPRSKCRNAAPASSGGHGSSQIAWSLHMNYSCNVNMDPNLGKATLGPSWFTLVSSDSTSVCRPPNFQKGNCYRSEFAMATSKNQNVKPKNMGIDNPDEPFKAAQLSKIQLVYLQAYLPISIHLSIHPSIHPSSVDRHLVVYPSFCLSVCVPVLSAHTFVYWHQPSNQTNIN